MWDGQSAHNCLSPKGLGEKDLFVHVMGLHVIARLGILTVFGFQVVVSGERASKPFQCLLRWRAEATTLNRIRWSPWPKKTNGPENARAIQIVRKTIFTFSASEHAYLEMISFDSVGSSPAMQPSFHDLCTLRHSQLL